MIGPLVCVSTDSCVTHAFLIHRLSGFDYTLQRENFEAAWKDNFGSQRGMHVSTTHGLIEAIWRTLSSTLLLGDLEFRGQMRR